MWSWLAVWVVNSNSALCVGFIVKTWQWHEDVLVIKFSDDFSFQTFQQKSNEKSAGSSDTHWNTNIDQWPSSNVTVCDQNVVQKDWSNFVSDHTDQDQWGNEEGTQEWDNEDEKSTVSVINSGSVDLVMDESVVKSRDNTCKSTDGHESARVVKGSGNGANHDGTSDHTEVDFSETELSFGDVSDEHVGEDWCTESEEDVHVAFSPLVSGSGALDWETDGDAHEADEKKEGTQGWGEESDFVVGDLWTGDGEVWQGDTEGEVFSWGFLDEEWGDKGEDWAEEEDLTDSVIVHESFGSVGLVGGELGVKGEVECPGDLVDGWEEEDLGSIDSLEQAVEDDQLRDGVEEGDSHVVEGDLDLGSGQVVSIVDQSAVLGVVKGSFTSEAVKEDVEPEFLDCWRENCCEADDEESKEETCQGWSGVHGEQQSEGNQSEDQCHNVEDKSWSGVDQIHAGEACHDGVDSFPGTDFIDDVASEAISEEQTELNKQDEDTEDSHTCVTFFMPKVIGFVPWGIVNNRVGWHLWFEN